MTRDEIREISEIVGGDKEYKRFVKRINKEFEASDTDRNSSVYVLYVMDGEHKVGFTVIGFSPPKMRAWLKTFKEEGWVGKDFEMADDPFELMYMYVRPEFRDKGYGVKLFDKTVDFTKDKGVSEIYSYVSDRNSTALDFYRRMNAEVIQDFSDEDISSALIRWRL